MKKIILVATGDELTWRNRNDMRVLARDNPTYHGFVIAEVDDIYTNLYDSDAGNCNGLPYNGDCDEESVEAALVTAGIIRIEETAEPQPGRTTQDYLLDEAEAIIKDVARTASGRACLDSARTLAFIVDLQNYRSSK